LPPGRSPSAGGGAESATAAGAGPEREIEELRTRYSATYEEGEGTRRAEVFAGPVHYQAPEGRWREIDNTLVGSPRAGYAYENRANSFKVLFPADLEAKPIRVEAAGESVSFQLEGAAGAPVAPAGAGESTATYPDALPGVEVSYRVLADSVEELIELPGPEAAQEFSFATDLSAGLELEREADGGLAVVDERGEEPFELAPALIYDAAGEAEPLELKLDETVAGADAEVSLTPDPEWLQDPERVYPVTVDPTVVTKLGAGGGSDPELGKDCWIGPDVAAVRCTSSSLQLGGAGSARRRALLRFNLKSIPNEAEILAARLDLHVNSKTGGGSPAADGHRLSQGWSKNAVTWVKRTATANWTSPGGTYLASPYPNPQVGEALGAWESWDLTGPARTWHGDVTKNDGLVLKTTSETNSTVVKLDASEGPDTTDPVLNVTYESPLGLAIQALGSHSARLTWAPPAGVSAETVIERREVGAGAGWRTIDVVPAGTSAYTDYLLWRGTSYEYRVLAGSEGESMEEEIPAATPATTIPRLYAGTSFWNKPITGPASGKPWDQLEPADLAPNSTAVVGKSFVSPVKKDGDPAEPPNFTANETWGQSLVYADPASRSYAIKCPTAPLPVPDCYMPYVPARDLVRLPRYATAAVNQGDDRKLTVLDPAGNTEYGMNQAAYDASKDTGAGSLAWTSTGRARYRIDGSGFAVDDNDGTPCQGEGDFCGGPTVSGLSNMAGVVRPEEIADGSIDHALAISSPFTRAGIMACPGTSRGEGWSPDPDAVPIGARVQLDPSYAIPPGWPDAIETIAEALKRHGAFVRDTGGSVAIQGENKLGRGYNPWTEEGKLNDATGEKDRIALDGLTPPFPLGALRVIAYKKNTGSGCVEP